MQLTEAIAMLENEALHQSSKTTWADLGCGDGTFTQALASHLQPGSKIFAIDSSAAVENVATQ